MEFNRSKGFEIKPIKFQLIQVCEFGIHVNKDVHLAGHANSKLILFLPTLYTLRPQLICRFRPPFRKPHVTLPSPTRFFNNNPTPAHFRYPSSLSSPTPPSPLATTDSLTPLTVLSSRQPDDTRRISVCVRVCRHSLNLVLFQSHTRYLLTSPT